MMLRGREGAQCAFRLIWINPRDPDLGLNYLFFCAYMLLEIQYNLSG